MNGIKNSVSASYAVRRADSVADHATMSGLWARNMTDRRIASRTEPRMQWLYGDNPAGLVRTWLLCTSTGIVVGCGSVLPRVVCVNGVNVRCGLLIDFAVDAAHRTAGPALQIQRTILAADSTHQLDFMLAWPNRNSSAVVTRAGYTVVGQSSLWVKPLSWHAELVKRLGRRGDTQSPLAFAIRLIAGFIEPCSLAADLLRTVPFTFRWQTEVADRADDRFSSLLGRTRQAYITARKDVAWLNWRYASFSTVGHRFFLLFDRRDRQRLVAYAIYSINDGRVTISDLCCEDMRQHLTPLLLRLALRLRREGIQAISLIYVGTALFARRLRTLQFFRSQHTRTLMVSLNTSASPALKRDVLDAEQWLIFDGDLDI